MTSSEIISICAIVAGPSSGMLLSLWVTHKRENRERKIKLFLTLLSQRKKIPMTEEFVNSLNVIDVIFRGNKKVIEAKKELLDCQNVDPSNYFNAENYNKKVLDLLDAMSKKLGYKEIRQTGFDSPFIILTADERSLTQ